MSERIRQVHPREAPASAPAKTKARSVVDKSWHLAASEHEINLTEFEYSLERVAQAFYRWKSECLTTVSEHGFTGQDTAILHVIRMNDRPKGLSEIARLLNREDSSNIQYTLRKLLQTGLIERVNAASRKGTSYQVTAEGRSVTDRYAQLRREILVKLTQSIAGSDESLVGAADFLGLLTGLYDQSARVAATHRR